MKTSRLTLPTMAAVAVFQLLALPKATLGLGVLTIISHTHNEGTPSSRGRSLITTSAKARYDGIPGDDEGRDASLGTGVKESNATWNYINQGYETTRKFKIMADGQMETCNTSCGGRTTIDVCAGGALPTQFDRKTEVSIVRDCATCNFEDTKETMHSSSYCTPPPCFNSNCEVVTGGDKPYCCGSPRVCSECSTSRFQCEEKYGIPPEGRWTCNGCACVLASSPLVVYLPDYSSSSGASQSWWKNGFCSQETPRVCLDWLGNGNVTCTGWTAPGTEIAFVVNLSDDDLLRLTADDPVPAQPWRHFFGNVTMGPNGRFPFEHGFEALATHCGQDPAATSEIVFSECGSSLHVWNDRTGDGDIDPDEIIEFQDLGIDSLGELRETGKRDACGNTFPYESHASCTDRSGRCGKWYDVFFVPR